MLLRQDTKYNNRKNNQPKNQQHHRHGVWDFPISLTFQNGQSIPRRLKGQSTKQHHPEEEEEDRTTHKGREVKVAPHKNAVEKQHRPLGRGRRRSTQLCEVYLGSFRDFVAPPAVTEGDSKTNSVYKIKSGKHPPSSWEGQSPCGQICVTS